MFNRGLAKFSVADFEAAGITAEDRFLIESTADQEAGHATLITNMLGSRHAPKQCTFLCQPDLRLVFRSHGVGLCLLHTLALAQAIKYKQWLPQYYMALTPLGRVSHGGTSPPRSSSSEPATGANHLVSSQVNGSVLPEFSDLQRLQTSHHS